MKIITLHTRHTTYQMGISEMGFVHHLYYGPKAFGDMSGLISMRDRGFSGNPYEGRDNRSCSMDAMPMEYPCYGCGDYRSPAFNISDAAGIYGADLRYKGCRILPGKYSIPGLPAVYDQKPGSDGAHGVGDADWDTSDKNVETDGRRVCTVELLLADGRTGVRVYLRYGILPEADVITRSAAVANDGKGIVHVHKLVSTALDFVSGDFDLIHFHGRHAMERMKERSPLSHGSLVISSFRGTSSHQHNPFVILANRETGEDSGLCWGAALLYSGNFKCEAVLDQYGQTRLLMGLSEDMLDYRLKPGDIFYSPEAAMACSTDGLTGLSHIFHRLIRKNVCRGPWRDVRRPVLINNWEATYFDFNGEKLERIAREAADLGVEMMVLDDGWFGHRERDDSSLGDWYVNEEKLGCTLAELSGRIHDAGMKFGLWIEPEMVSENSDLYRAHPDWAFTIPGRRPVVSRNQLVLDFSRPEVADHIFDQIAAVLDSARVDYIKMDMNRSICDVYTAVGECQNCGAIMHQYVLGVYRFLERLTGRYPQLLIEGCSGGGGRFDAGMLYYTPQIWCSDNTDAIDRTLIQHGTSFAYPACCVGAHVSAVPNHQTGRITPMKTRIITAMAGTFGYELDPGALSPEEKAQVREGVGLYKRFWPLIHGGDYYRLTDPDTDRDAMAWAFVSEDKKEALVSMVMENTHGNAPAIYIPVKGLAPEKFYRLEEIGSPEDNRSPGWHFREKGAAPGIYSGSALAHMGLYIPAGRGAYGSVLYALTQVAEDEVPG